MIFLYTFAAFFIVIIAMAIGYIIQKKTIAGSCGGFCSPALPFPCLPVAVAPQAPQAEVALAATEASGRSSDRPAVRRRRQSEYNAARVCHPGKK